MLYCFQSASFDMQAEQGKVCQDLLHQLLKDDFYYKSPPKSTGREVCQSTNVQVSILILITKPTDPFLLQEFGTKFLTSFLEEAKKYNLASEDCVATATELTAQVLHMNYNLHIKQLLQCGHDEVTRPVLFASGGGIYNHYLVR